MGCDGGTIPRRDELVRTKQKPEKVDKDAETNAKWKHCAINQEELREPVVCCELGRLYNKDAVIEYLLDKSAFGNDVAHIRNLKDVKELQLTINPAFEKSMGDKGDEYVDRQRSKYMCPVTALEMNGKHKFVYLWTCRCVLSERSLKEVKSDLCHRCGQKYEKEDVIVINGSSDEVEVLKERMESRRTKAKLEKQLKKEQKNLKRNGVAVEGESSGIKKSKKDGATKESSTNPSKVKSSIKRVVDSEEKLKSSYKVSNDPKASETYKSLFTSHNTCKEQPRAHWITYNPLYN